MCVCGKVITIIVLFSTHFPQLETKRSIGRACIYKRLWITGTDSARLGIDSWAPEKVYKYVLWIRFEKIRLVFIK